MMHVMCVQVCAFVRVLPGWPCWQAVPIDVLLLAGLSATCLLPRSRE